MPPTRKPDRYVQHWETVAVTALPTGWRNIYKLDDGTFTSTPSPAILLQEHRETDRIWDIPRGDGTYTIDIQTDRMKPPYETRAVFADFDECGLSPVDEVGNYVQTIGPDEAPPQA